MNRLNQIFYSKLVSLETTNNIAEWNHSSAVFFSVEEFTHTFKKHLSYWKQNMEEEPMLIVTLTEWHHTHTHTHTHLFCHFNYAEPELYDLLYLGSYLYLN